MNGTTSDVLVHVKDPLGASEQTRLARALAAVKGVARTRFAERARNLVIVYFDPKFATPQDVLNGVTAQGFSARLIGL